MKKLCPIVVMLLLTCFTAISQAPQGINYQAVALDGAGNPVVSQPIGIRLTILDGGATGTLVYQETQHPSTDITGLFSIVIGNGTVVSGTFNNIKWGNGSKWLKTEIDITGGTSYVLMGSSQFMSVPYALYANRTNTVTTSFQHPDGLENITPVLLDHSIPYTVPAGKNLYMNRGSATIDTFGLIDWIQTTGSKMYNFIGASDGSVVKFTGMGFLVDKIVEWKTIDIQHTPLIVPAGKLFVIVCQNEYLPSSGCDVTLNGTVIDHYSPVLTNAVIDAGSIVSVSGTSCTGTGYYVINGYFRDK
jgi:hypothetical protein